jgi:hypothetical protein
VNRVTMSRISSWGKAMISSRSGTSGNGGWAPTVIGGIEAALTATGRFSAVTFSRSSAVYPFNASSTFACGTPIHHVNSGSYPL